MTYYKITSDDPISCFISHWQCCFHRGHYYHREFFQFHLGQQCARTNAATRSPSHQEPINPYGKAKKMAEDIILDFSKNSDMSIMILRYFNVIESDPDGRALCLPAFDFQHSVGLIAKSRYS
uniref:NAD-dependent epimerase/dehydratase domain-containing protein n=1 Tax=Salix viminalis TaxID=40686 RepID=A0A6N2KKC5_SALVM